MNGFDSDHGRGPMDHRPGAREITRMDPTRATTAYPAIAGTVRVRAHVDNPGSGRRPCRWSPEVITSGYSLVSGSDNVNESDTRDHSRGPMDHRPGARETTRMNPTRATTAGVRWTTVGVRAR